MADYEKILQSFETKKTLNPKVWNNSDEPEDASLKKEVRQALLKIAEEFSDYLGEDIFVEDIVLTGSLSNYNWSEFSDFDLHLKIDFNQFEDDSELYQKLFDLKRQVFNDKHDIKIYGYDVELYAQSTVEKHFSAGEFSVQNNEWIKIPKKQELVIDEEVLKQKIENWKKNIDSSVEEGDPKKLEKLKEKLKKFRQCGIEEKGEFSYENLTFKFLRRSGDIKKLFDSLNKSVDKKLSINEDFSFMDLLTQIKNFLKSLGLWSKEELMPYFDKNVGKGDLKNDGMFTYVDLNTSQGYEIYKNICQNFISLRNPNAGVTGDMLANSARKYLNKAYIPPELALSQLALEGGLTKDKSKRPIYTNNPFNVGNVDSGANRYFPSKQDGVDYYYKKMSELYLSKGRNPQDLLKNFVNINNNRYASNPNYEEGLTKIINFINQKISKPLLSQYSKTPSNLS